MFKLLLILLFIIALILFIDTCFIEPNRLIKVEYKIKNPDMKGLKAVFVSDFHIKKHGAKRLQKIVDMIKAQNPDIILCTGDFAAEHKLKTSYDIKKTAKALGGIKTKYGFYTVLGNHDNLADGDYIAEQLRNNGIVILENSNTHINYNGKNIYIAGLADLQTREPDVEKALEGCETPTIMLTHTPDTFPDIPERVTLTLAGHTHGGQIRMPFVGAILIPSDYGEKYAVGLKHKNNKTMLVTKGMGTSILPWRFNCTPEIVVINFV